MKKCLPFLVVIGVAVWSVWPAVVHPAGVADYGRDGWLIAWIEKSWQKKFTDYIRPGKMEWGSLFSGDIFYPYKSVLAYTSMLMLSGLVGWSGPGAVMAVGQIATMAVTYWWFKKMGGSRWGAVVGAAAFGLARARWEYQVHMQIWSMQYWLTGAWLICSWMEDKRIWKIITGAVILGLQMWEEPLGIYFAALLITVKLIFNFQFTIYNLKSIFKSQFTNIKTIIAGGVIFGLIAFLPAREYWRVSNEFNFVRSIRDAAYHGLSINGMGRFWSTGLGVLGIVAIYRLFKSQFAPLRQGYVGQANIKWLALVLITSVVLSLGPVVKWDDKTVKIGGKAPIPLPYAAVYYLVPGMKAFRVPSRWMILAAWSVAGLISIQISKSQITNPKSQSNPKSQIPSSQIKYFIGIVGCLVVAIMGGERLTKYRILPTPAEFPGVYRWLKNQPGQVIAELPFGNENDEAERMWYSTGHAKKLLGGYTGFIPPERTAFMAQLNKDPFGKGTINKLREVRVDYLIIHKQIFNSQFTNSNLKIVYEDGETEVYGLE